MYLPGAASIFPVSGLKRSIFSADIGISTIAFFPAFMFTRLNPLRLMVKGMINKEMAETLGISATTVIFHRNNICDKLGTRSIGKLTIFAVLSGIIDINEI